MCQMLFQMFSQLYKHYFKSQEITDTENLKSPEMTDKMALLEKKVTDLENQNKDLEKQLEMNRNREAALQKVLCNYDNFLKKVLIEKAEASSDKRECYLADLEGAFYDLLQKYEKAKLVVRGFQQNEAVLKKQVEEYENILDSLRVKFTTYKHLSDNQLEIENEQARTKSLKTPASSKGKKRKLLTSI